MTTRAALATPGRRGMARRMLLASATICTPIHKVCCAGAEAPLCSSESGSCTTVVFEAKRLGLELIDSFDGRVQIKRIEQQSEALQKGVLPLSFVEEVDGMNVRGMEASGVVRLLQRTRRPVTLRLDSISAYAGLSPEAALEKAAQAQGFETARVTIQKVPGAASQGVAGMLSREGDVIEIDYVGRVAETGREFDGRHRFSLLLGNGDVVRGLEIGLLEMGIGEVRWLRVPPDLGFGSRGSRVFGVPGGATLQYEVQLRSINQQTNRALRREDVPDERRF